MKLSLLFLIIAVYACKQDKGNQKYVISGQIESLGDTTIILEEMDLNQLTFIDSVSSKDDGSFKFNVDLKPNRLYYISIKGERIPIITDSNNIKIFGTWPLLNNLEIRGSLGSASLNSFIDNLKEKSNRLAAQQLSLDSLVSLDGQDSLLQITEKEIEYAMDDLVNYVKTYAKSVNNLQAALYAAKLLNPVVEHEYFNKLAKSIKERFPNDPFAYTFIDIIENGGNKKISSIQIGEEAPDFTLVDNHGKKVSLSDFRGKYVLLDFWASWCPPCRRENPNIVAAYNRYKSYNFEIVGISLDNNKSKWLQAINEDGLKWVNLNDPQEWKSPLVELYDFDRIPSNYLIGPDGKLISINLYGDELNSKLMQIFAIAKDDIKTQPL